MKSTFFPLSAVAPSDHALHLARSSRACHVFPLLRHYDRTNKEINVHRQPFLDTGWLKDRTDNRGYVARAWMR